MTLQHQITRKKLTYLRVSIDFSEESENPFYLITKSFVKHAIYVDEIKNKIKEVTFSFKDKKVEKEYEGYLELPKNINKNINYVKRTFDIDYINEVIDEIKKEFDVKLIEVEAMNEEIEIENSEDTFIYERFCPVNIIFLEKDKTIPTIITSETFDNAIKKIKKVEPIYEIEDFIDEEVYLVAISSRGLMEFNSFLFKKYIDGEIKKIKITHTSPYPELYDDLGKKINKDVCYYVPYNPLYPTYLKTYKFGRIEYENFYNSLIEIEEPIILIPTISEEEVDVYLYYNGYAYTKISKNLAKKVDELLSLNNQELLGRLVGFIGPYELMPIFISGYGKNYENKTVEINPAMDLWWYVPSYYLFKL